MLLVMRNSAVMRNGFANTSTWDLQALQSQRKLAARGPKQAAPAVKGKRITHKAMRKRPQCNPQLCRRESMKRPSSIERMPNGCWAAGPLKISKFPVQITTTLAQKQCVSPTGCHATALGPASMAAVKPRLLDCSPRHCLSQET